MHRSRSVAARPSVYRCPSMCFPKIPSLFLILGPKEFALFPEGSVGRGPQPLRVSSFRFHSRLRSSFSYHRSMVLPFVSPPFFLIAHVLVSSPLPRPRRRWFLVLVGVQAVLPCLPWFPPGLGTGSPSFWPVAPLFFSSRLPLRSWRPCA